MTCSTTANETYNRWHMNGRIFQVKSERLMKESLTFIAGFAGQRARVPPDPIPNSEVKPCSVPSGSVVFGHVNLGKLATHFIPAKTGEN
jgi:hypothetical protein